MKYTLDRLIDAIEREEKEELLKQFVESLRVQAEAEGESTDEG